MSEFKASPYQQAIFDFVERGQGSAVVIAVAGSGKSTTLGHAITRMPARCSAQIFAFNKSTADDFNARLTELKGAGLNVPSGVRAGTFHSVCYSVVKRFLQLGELKPRGDKIRKLCDETYSDEQRELYGEFVSKLVGLAKGEGIGVLRPDLPAAWWDLVRHHDLSLESERASEAEAIELARGMLKYSCQVARRGVVDFDDLLYLPLLWKLRLWQNDWVLIDEAQDTNPVRRAIAKLALRPGGRLLAVGDGRQAIYGFTGASHDAIELIKKEFNAIELPLTVSYRCARAVVAEAKTVVPYIEAHDEAPIGLVERMSDQDALRALGPTDAILCRNAAPLFTLAFNLIANKRGCRIEGRDICEGLVKLIGSMRAKTIDGLREKLGAWAVREIGAAMAKGEERKAEAISDKAACLEAVMDALDENSRTIPKMIARLKELFEDQRGVLTLSTIHKAKGWEWERVGVYCPELLPSRWARQDWQLLQEDNLKYVAITRAKQHLIWMEG